MVHTTGRDSRLEAQDFYQRQQSQHHSYYRQDDYVHQVYPQQQHHHFKHQVYPGAPQSPPSPPIEEPANKPSLPSISSLLGIADGDQHSTQDSGAPSQQTSPSQQQSQQPQQPQQQQQQQQQHQPVQQPQQPPQRHLHQAQRPPQPETRTDQAQPAYGPTIVSHPRMTLPPTPPMRPDSVIDGNQSPSTSSQSSIPQQTPYYLGQSINNMEPHQQRQPIPTTASMAQHRSSLPPQHPASPYATSPYATSPYASSPGAASRGSFAYPPEQAMYASPAVYGQRPLPSNFPPPPMPVSVPVSTPGNPNPWQHHHYIGASSTAAFPQPQDRYICQTCNKAFSRPSSLRIHSHSHTGEKPFKCPHPNCGKAFSVRSNMKRHERGCHATASPSTHGS
ncbi:hypothetical protein BKA80DRAFT_253308 [Phyllosticta citrichinensis]